MPSLRHKQRRYEKPRMFHFLPKRDDLLRNNRMSGLGRNSSNTFPLSVDDFPTAKPPTKHQNHAPTHDFQGVAKNKCCESVFVPHTSPRQKPTAHKRQNNYAVRLTKELSQKLGLLAHTRCGYFFFVFPKHGTHLCLVEVSRFSCDQKKNGGVSRAVAFHPPA